MSYQTFTNSAAPATPAAGKTSCYIDTTGRLTAINATGVVNVMNSRNPDNFIRNGGMWFAQRQAPASLTTYSNTSGRSISADGWGITNETASVQYIRTDSSGSAETGLQARNYGTWSKTSNSGKIVLSQVIEGQDTTQIRGRTVRFQVLMKASSAKTIKIGVLQLTSAGTIDTMPATFVSAFGVASTDPTFGTNLSFLAPKTGVTGDNCTAGASNFSCSVTTAWQRFGGVVDVATTTKNIVPVIFTDGLFSVADSISVTQASLTDGYEIVDWSPLPYSLEFQRVQRYYYKTFAVDTNPATSAGTGTGEFKFIAIGNAVAITAVDFRFPVPLAKETGATLTLYNPSAGNAQVRNITDGADCSSSSITQNTARAAFITTTGSAAAAIGEHLGVHVTADAEL